MPEALAHAQIRQAPKVLLHDHLDGGLRPQTVLDLADAIGYDRLPEGARDAESLGRWFRASAGGGPGAGSLERFLEGCAHTVAVMATPEAMHRVARECVADLAADGVVYAEVRYAPELLEGRGVSMAAAIEAISDGLRVGEAQAVAAGQPIVVRTLLCAMRQHDRALQVAQLAVRYRDSGVVGFDIAGPEEGFAATRHAAAFEYLRRNNMRYTAHAGEAVGVASVWETVQLCCAERLGHGVRVIEDIAFDQHGDAALGRVAAYVRDRQIPLEICPTSNLLTAAADSIAGHPFDALRRLGFAVTVNTDDRLMCGTDLTDELALLSNQFGYGWDELERFASTALDAAFLPLPQREAIRRGVLGPGYAALRAL